MSLGMKVAQSSIRPLIDELLVKGFSAKKIARQLYESNQEETFSEGTIADYRANFFRAGDSPLMQVVKVTQDLGANEPPPSNDHETLAQHFTFKSTKFDLDLLYERIAKLKTLADAHPDDDQYDNRIKSYMDQAEKIRGRVFKHQYEQIRRAIMLTVGKKICMAAVSIFLPYIPAEKRNEAVSRFESMIGPLLDIRKLPDAPGEVDIVGDNPAAVPPAAKPTIVDDLPPAPPSESDGDQG